MKKRTVLFSVLAILLVIALIAIIASTVNDPPTAEANSVTTREDTPVLITVTGSDQDGDPLIYSVITGPSNGRLSGTEPNLTYSPNTNFNGPDSFTFKVNDGKADSSAATVSITVIAVNDEPTASEDSATTQEDAPIVTIDVLANDTDLDDDRLVVITATQGSNGSVTINTDRTVTYAPNRNFCGTDTFTYTISDGKGGTGKAAVKVTVNPVNDAPLITSKPVEMTRVWASYTYDVNAKDPDSGDSLTYSLAAKPEGMTVDPATGLIAWRPTSAQAGTYDVQIKVEDSNSIPVSDIQSFSITVTSLSSPLTNTLTVADCYDQRSKKTSSTDGKIAVVQASDNDRLETEPGSYTCYEFCDASIPEGAAVKSVVFYVEHFEEERFPDGQLQWCVGTGWPAKPVVWASTNAPVRIGKVNEATDLWDVTSYVDTPEKANSIQLQVTNNNNAAKAKTSVNYIYAVIEWY